MSIYQKQPLPQGCQKYLSQLSNDTKHTEIVKWIKKSRIAAKNNKTGQKKAKQLPTWI